MAFQTHFTLAVGSDDETGQWAVQINSVAENKYTQFHEPSFARAMRQAIQKMRKREILNRKFPVSPIFGPNGARMRLTEGRSRS